MKMKYDGGKAEFPFKAASKVNKGGMKKAKTKKGGKGQPRKYT